MKKIKNLKLKNQEVFTMKRIFVITLVFVVCCFMVTSTWAAKKVSITKANSKGYIGQLNQGAAMGKAFGLSQDGGHRMLRQRTDFNGVTHSRYQQTFRGFPVWGIQTIVSKGRSGQVVRLNGNILQGIGRDVGSIPGNLNAKAELARMKAGFAGPIFSSEEAGTFIYLHKGSARLCNVVSFFNDDECGNPSRPVFFLDARSGQVIHSFDSLTYAYDGTGPGGNLKVGYYYYGIDFTKFGVSINGSTCTMDYADCKTVDLNHGTSGSTAYSYTCYENTHKEINGAYCPLNDAQFFGQQVYNMYMDWYGVPVLPFQLMMRVHYSTNYENAFWNGSSMTFGDGYSTFYPLVALDVSAHEVAHGFTDNYSDLIYSGESGGINEAYSDMAGEAAKYYMRGTNDFMCGFDIFKNPSQALRYLCNPPQDGRSIDHVDDYYAGMDVHYSSGIFNKAFCEIATSTGWTTQMAFDIFTKANMDYWTPSTNFQQGAEGALSAATDYGYNTDDVVAAFAVVGIDLGPPPPQCSITVTAPNGGEQWQDSTTQTITWTSVDGPTNVKILLSTNGGKKFNTIVGSTPNDGSYNWSIPSQKKNQTKCQIKVAALDDSCEDTSDANFTILK
jgi:pseudolysin/vibriolysin